MKISPCRFLLLFVFSLMLGSYAAAQNRSILGKVTDADGNPLDKVRITIIGTDNPRNLKVDTNSKGEYLYLLGLQPGTYHVVARKEGFMPEREAYVKPELGEEVEVNFTLKPGNDFKFPHEMTDEERKEYLKQVEEQGEKQKFSAAVSEAFDKGMEFSDKKMYAEAIEEFMKAYELDDSQVAVISRIGESYMKMKKYEEALEFYEKAIALNPPDINNLYNNKGVILDKLGRKKESRQAFEMATSGGGAQELYNLGVTQYNDGKMEEAAASFQRAIAADNGYAEAYFLLGNCLLGNQDTICDAIDAFKKYTKLGGKAENIDVAKAMIDALGSDCK